ncbi:MAG: hypothetical protein Q4D62_06650 [Planctomycetia bacterium]|nr:hypothetical protein [Planctomycetia bacterium]
MKKWTMTLAFLLVGVWSVAAMADDPQPEKKERPGKGWVCQKMEADGFIVIADLPEDAPKWAPKMLAKADADKDGKVTKEEMKKFFENRPKDGKGPHGKPGGPHHGKPCPPPGPAPKWDGKGPHGMMPPKGFHPEMMKKVYADGFKDGFKAAMEMQRKPGHPGKWQGKPCPCDKKCKDCPCPKKEGKCPCEKDGKKCECPKRGQKWEDPFKKYGKEGVITISELPGDVWPRFVEDLKAADADQDGKVCRQEFGQYKKAQWEKKKAEREAKNKDKDKDKE